MTKGQKLVTVISAITVPFIILAITAWFYGVRYNVSESQPVGFYRLIKADTRPVIGELFFVCPPDSEIMQVALARDYLARGTCSGGYAPLLKRVAALEGMTVSVTAEAVLVDGTEQPNSKPYPVDSFDRPLPRFDGGIVHTGQVLLLSAYNDGSFDGRYFGTLPVESIIGRAKPLF